LHVDRAPQQRDTAAQEQAGEKRPSPVFVGFTGVPPMIARGPTARWATEMPITMTPNSASSA
jgi:hypothetical protein